MQLTVPDKQANGSIWLTVREALSYGGQIPLCQKGLTVPLPKLYYGWGVSIWRAYTGPVGVRVTVSQLASIIAARFKQVGLRYVCPYDTQEIE